MLSAMRQVIDFLNLVDAESESEGDTQLESALKSAKEVALRDLPESRNFTFKASANRHEKKMRISYAVKASIGEIVKDQLGVSANREVGEKTFDYYVKSEGLQ
jgi:hypothetical protein